MDAPRPHATKLTAPSNKSDPVNLAYGNGRLEPGYPGQDGIPIRDVAKLIKPVLLPAFSVSSTRAGANQVGQGSSS